MAQKKKNQLYIGWNYPYSSSKESEHLQQFVISHLPNPVF
jgi:hypothetical protein